MATQYDPGIIYTFADRLYARAKSIVLIYAALGAVLGAIGGVVVAVQGSSTALVVVGIGIFGGIGAMIGHDRGFTLRLQAQTALCQVKIEESVRHLAQSAGAQQSAPSQHYAPAQAPPYAMPR